MAQVSHSQARQTSRSNNNASPAAWGYVLQLVSLPAVFAAAVFLSLNERQTWPVSWSAVFVGLGVLCLGFGAGMLFYQRRQRADVAALREDYAKISARAQALGAEMDARIKRKQTPAP